MGAPAGSPAGALVHSGPRMPAGAAVLPRWPARRAAPAIGLRRVRSRHPAATDGPSAHNRRVPDDERPLRPLIAEGRAARVYDVCRTGRPGRLLHGDLQPDSVLLSPEGPVLIDGSNAATGPSSYDTATTSLVLACFSHPDPAVESRLGRLHRPLTEAFLAGVDRAAAAGLMEVVTAHRLVDPATSALERIRIRRFGRALAGGAADG